MERTAEIAQRDASGENLNGGKLKVAVSGATGMVGQQLVTLLADHPWFEVALVAASSSSAGKLYREAVAERWTQTSAVPAKIADLKVHDVQDVNEIASLADIVFCAVSLDKEGVLKLEHAYADAGLWVTSNNSAYRLDPFVPMVIPAVNANHLDVIPFQRRARGYNTGALMVKSNCSIQSYVIALEPLKDFGLESIAVHSEQAISGAGKTFASFPEIEQNLIPLINGEERKSEIEPLKIWGKVGGDGIVPASGPKIKAKCVRVPVPHGHTAYVTARFKSAPSVLEILERWDACPGPENLPSAPMKQIHYLTDPDRPQPRLDVMTDGGMAVSVGQLSVEDDRTVLFTALSHNLILGAAGGAVLATEAAIGRGLVFRRV